MSKSLTVQNNYARGCFQAVSEKYTFFQRITMGPGFYSRETYITAQRSAALSQPNYQGTPQGLERRLSQGYKSPQVIDTSIVNRIAPKEKPRVYAQRETGYVNPGANRIRAHQKPKINRLERYRQPERKLTPNSKTEPNYEMLSSDVPNDFYLTPKDIQATLARGYQGMVYENNDKEKLLESLDLKQCQNCSTPIVFGRLCNRCIALN